MAKRKRSATHSVSAETAINGERFRTIADYTYDWESWHDPQGGLIWVNRAVQRTTGYTTEECLTMADYPLPMVIEEDRPRIADVLSKARQGTTGANVEFGCLNRSGEVRWMSLAWQPMYESSDEYLGFRTSVRDITEVRKLRDQLRLYTEHLEQLVQERTTKLRQLEHRQRQMEKLAALGQLAAGVAHEINNPLAGMRNAFELIKTSLPTDHEHFSLLELIDREIERISGIVHQMYRLYRRTPQQPAEFNLVQTIEEVVCMLEHAARQRRVTIQFTPSGPMRAFLVEGEVKQILYNLIRNALQASPPEATVKVDVRARKNEMLVHIDDIGAGIAPEVLSQIFDPFFSTKQGADQGMGLGLSVSHSLIDAMGGRIEVSTHVGQGSRFSAIFPIRIENALGSMND